MASSPPQQASETMPTSSNTSLACSHAIGSSSTISTRRSCGRISGSSCACLSVVRSVTVTVKVEPTPFSLSTAMLPFIISTMFLVMAMPSPVLPYLLLLCSSSCEKGSNIFGR